MALQAVSGVSLCVSLCVKGICHENHEISTVLYDTVHIYADTVHMYADRIANYSCVS